MIATKQLIFGYEKQEQITFPDFTCPSGETLLITGKSGTGKTTLLHLLSGLLNPISGSIQIHQTDITQLNASEMDAFRGKNIGIVFQQSYFVESLSVWDNLQLATWLGKSDTTSASIQQLLKDLQLEDYAHKKTYQLSLGQQQRVSIARALVNQPSVILADEPTAALDDENTLIVAQLLQKMAKSTGAALLIVTHDNRLKQMFNRVVALS